MSGAFDTIRELVPIANVIKRAGVEIRRGGFCLCPFHRESSPSFKIYEEENRFHCFGCGVGGDAVSFVARTDGLSNIDAAKKISEDYGLGLFSEKLSPAARRKLNAERKQREEKRRKEEADKRLIDKLEEWRDGKIYALNIYAQTLAGWAKEFMPQTPEAQIDPRYIEAVCNLPEVQYLIEVYECAFIGELAAMYKTEKKRAKRWGR